MRCLRRLNLLPALLVWAWSCSSGPTPPKPGTPGFYWNAARENFAKGDYVKTNEQLGRITAGDNEYTARARAWRLILLSGMAEGNIELVNAFETGGKANKTNPAPFFREMARVRSIAGNLATQFLEEYERWMQAKQEGPVSLDFPAPLGSAAAVAQLERVASGMVLRPQDIETLERDVIRRGVILAACRAIGAPKDAAKLIETLKQPPATVAKETFLAGMAESLWTQAALFGPKRMQRPEFQKRFLSLSLEALNALPDSKEGKELKQKVEKELKSLKS